MDEPKKTTTKKPVTAKKAGKEPVEKKSEKNPTEKKIEDNSKAVKGKEINLDKFSDLIKLVVNNKDINDLRPIIYRHILKIIERNTISENYHILFIYEPNKSIEQDMVDLIYNAIPDNNTKPILLIIHNNGGRIEPAYLISKTCKELSPKFIVAIPRKAKSAATLISLGGSEIHMGSMSEIGPIDPQFGGLPALGISSSLESIAKIVTEYPKSSSMFADYLKEKLDLRILGYFERVSESAKQYAIRLLNGKNLPKKLEDIAHQLVYEYKDHSFVIDKEEACELLGDMIVVNSEEYKFSNDIHKFLSSMNLVLGILKKKSVAIVGSERDINISDKKENKE